MTGWNAPRKSLLLVHPAGEGSRATNSELNISFDPAPDYSGIAKAASCHNASNVEGMREQLSEAIAAVVAGSPAILDVHVSSPSVF